MSKLIALKEKLAARQPVLSSTIANLSWSGIIQKASAFSFDMMMFDLEHGTLSVESVESLLRMCRLCDLPSVVRVPDCVPHMISKTLDMGADGVLIPRVECMEQVETAIRCSRYYPRGRKGCGGFSNLRAEDKGNTDVYNENRMIFIQMESNEGLEILPEILDKYGKELAGVLIGPYDTSIMIGTPLDITSDAMTDYIRKVFEVCNNYGIACGSFVDSPALFARYRDLGANVYWTGTDIGMLCTGFQVTCDAFKTEIEK